MAAAMSLLLALAGCSDDGFEGVDVGTGADLGPGKDSKVGPKKDGKVGPKKDGPVNPKKDGPVNPKKDGPVNPKKDGPVGPKKDKGQPQPDKATPKKDGQVSAKLPPPPPGAVILRISVDDSIDKTYSGGELLLKGNFKYNPKTNVISPDSKWSGPFVPLWDDGPGGREGPGSKAWDHKLGTVVYAQPGSTTTYQYGLISPAGWMWPSSGNAKVTIKPGGGTVNMPGHKLPPRAGVDLLWTVDNKYLSGKKVDPGYQAVVIRSTATHWAPLLCNDEGLKGDKKKGDAIYSCRLSAQIGKGRLFPHLGLARPGDKVRFYVDIGGSSYTKPNGVTCHATHGGGTTALKVAASGSNLNVAVPSGFKAIGAPAPEKGGLPSGKAGNMSGGIFDLPSATVGIQGKYIIPTSYDAHRPTPVLVALHGAYEQGIWMVNVWKTLAEETGFIVLAPSSMKKSWDLSAVFYPSPSNPVDEEAPIIKALSWLKGRYNVAGNRVAVEGFSDGGSMTLYMGLNHKSFCAAMPNSPGGMGKKALAGHKPPFWITHGDADKILPVANARAISKNLKTAGYDVTYTEFKGGHHVFPTSLKLPMVSWWWKKCGGAYPP